MKKNVLPLLVLLNYMLWILLNKHCFTNEFLKVDRVIEELPDPILLSGSDHRRRTGQAELGAGSSQVTWVPNQRSSMGPVSKPGIKQFKKKMRSRLSLDFIAFRPACMFTSVLL